MEVRVAMVARKMSVREARASFSDVLGHVHFTGEPLVIEKNGQPYAAVVSLEDLAWLKRRREEAWAAIDRIRARNAGKDLDEIDRDVTEAVDEVRRQRHEQEKAAHPGRR